MIEKLANLPLYAHTPGRQEDGFQTLWDHSHAVAESAAAFAEAFGCDQVARSVGWTHDAGKADPKFQRYLRAAASGERAPKCPHAHAGAVAAYETLGPFALAVAGHHAGLPDASEFKALTNTETNTDAETIACARRFLEHACPAALARLDIDAPTDPLAAEFLVRMVFSTLVDADYLDTERHFDPDAPDRRGRYPSLDQYRDLLDRHLAGLADRTGPINDRRRAILRTCRAAADRPPGFFDLQVPTGGGKTLSGLAFALDHAVCHGLRRVVVAIPYTSIVDQTADVYGAIFGAENILEHHSAVLDGSEAEEPSPEERRRRLAAENWDCPLIVTTTVQLFESLHSNRPSRCRKLHRLAKSVIVLDEVQTLPNECVGPCLAALKELVRRYGCTVVFSTATLPDFSVVDPEVPADRTPLVPDFAGHFEALRRVRYEVRPAPLAHEDLAQTLDMEARVLAVLNTRKDALETARRCRDDEDLFLLSTLLCGHHRKRVIAAVRRRLAERKPVRLVSTQVIEAGVDMDFPIVYRVVGPLDRIVQVAGRCNREGNLSEPGLCVVFELADGREPAGSYRTATACTRTILKKGCFDLDQPDVLARYFRDVFRHTETGSLQKAGDRADVLKLRSEMAFARVANAFRIIDELTFPVVVEQYQPADESDAADLVPRLLASWEHAPLGWHRRIAPYTVSLPSHDRDRLARSGRLRLHDSGIHVFSGPYHQKFGLADVPADPDSLIQ